MNPLLLRLLPYIAAVLIGATGAWAWQANTYGKELADQARLHTEALAQLAIVGAAAQKDEQDKRYALERRLATSDQSHQENLTNAQKDQARLRNRLATSDLRLSVLLNQGSAGGCSVPTTAPAVGVVHGTVRAELDPAHAQRIIAITDEGDRGLIALAACQAYVNALNSENR